MPVTLTGGMTLSSIGGMRITVPVPPAITNSWADPANIIISAEVPFKSTSIYNVDGSTMTGNVTIDGDEASTTRWTTDANVIISAGVPFVTTSEVET